MNASSVLKASYRSGLRNWLIYAVLVGGILWLRGDFRASMIWLMVLGLAIGLVIWPGFDLLRYAVTTRGRAQAH